MTTCWPESRCVDLACRVDAVAAGHADVHQNDVGRELRDEAHGLVAVLGAADDDEPAVGVEDLLARAAASFSSSSQTMMRSGVLGHVAEPATVARRMRQ